MCRYQQNSSTVILDILNISQTTCYTGTVYNPIDTGGGGSSSIADSPIVIILF
jgi:hypothetical protein